jgi:hypothetical protein
MSKFKEGDEVQISNKSIYAYQGLNSDGEKMRGVINRLDSSGWWEVTWENNTTNTYPDEDLEPYINAQFKVTDYNGFELNERVICCESGLGLGRDYIGKEFEIIEFGDYGGDPGVKLKNVETGETHKNVMYNDFVGTTSIKKIETTSTSEPKRNVTFTVNGQTFNYSLARTHYKNGCHNDAIFNELEVDKHSFCSEAYGYEAISGSWPEWKYGDNEAPIKIVKAIREKIKEIESEPKMDVAEQPEENVTFTVNGETYRYVLNNAYYNNISGDNETIFNALGVDKHRFCSEAYGYEAYAGGWPEWRKGDNEAPIKIVKAIHEKIKQMKSGTKKQKYKFEVGDTVVGNSKATERYSVTQAGWRGVVTNVYADCFMAEGPAEGSGTYNFELQYEYFDHASEIKVDALLEEARSRYPIGTTYIPINGNSGKYLSSATSTWECKWVNNSDGVLFGIDCGLGYVYVNGKWAEIVGEPKAEPIDKDAILEEARRRYPIGTMYRALNLYGDYLGEYAEAIRECDWVYSSVDGIDCGVGYVYANGKWADVIKPEYISITGTIGHISDYPIMSRAEFDGGEGTFTLNTPSITSKRLPDGQEPIIIAKKEKKQKLIVI